MSELNFHLLVKPEQQYYDYLRSKLYADIRLTTGDAVPDDIHILVAGRPRREHLTNKAKLHSLIIPYAGMPPETAELLKDFRKMTVHNLHHNAPMTGEMAVALLLAAAKSLIPVDQTFRGHDWTPRYTDTPCMVLEGKTALVLGYGKVGRYVTRVCWAMGMRVLAIKRRVDERAANLVTLGALDKLHEWLPKAHILVVCLPGTPETTSLIGEDEIAMLPRGALVVNVGRGSVIDQKALYCALKDGHLMGAGLDVWYNYPPDPEARTHTPPSDYPFHELENVVMSPHRAGGGGLHEVEIRRMDALAESLNAAASGQPIPNRVDLRLGY